MGAIWATNSNQPSINNRLELIQVAHYKFEIEHFVEIEIANLRRARACLKSSIIIIHVLQIGPTIECERMKKKKTHSQRTHAQNLDLSPLTTKKKSSARQKTYRKFRWHQITRSCFSPQKKKNSTKFSISSKTNWTPCAVSYCNFSSQSKNFSSFSFFPIHRKHTLGTSSAIQFKVWSTN